MAVLAFDPEFRRRSAAPADGAAAPVRTSLADRAAGRSERRPVGRAVELPVGDRPGADRPWADRPVVRRVSHEPDVVAHVTPAWVVPPRPPAAEEGALARRFFPLALLVALVDLVTKALAVAWLAPGVTLGAALPLRLHLVYNAASAGGVSLGEGTRTLNVAATGVVIGLLVMLVPALTRVDRRAPLALALVAGGGLGNLASLLGSAPGVPDFLAIPHAGGAWVVNVADLALLAGLLLLGRTVWAIVRAIRLQGAGHPVPVAVRR